MTVEEQVLEQEGHMKRIEEKRRKRKVKDVCN
jgi:hypothetical protein